MAGAITDRDRDHHLAGRSPDRSPSTRCTGRRGGQLGETTGTSFTVRNLEPGRRYTVNVVARDNAGRASWASLPLTFTTTSPAEAGCTVKLPGHQRLGQRFRRVDRHHEQHAAGAVNGWTLAFTWPTTWQSVSSGWSATWEQTGTKVRVTSDGVLAAGGTATIGFVGSYSGPNVLPGAFTLNGTVCSTS